jgi:uncharacterized protein (TIGR02147 family)
MLIDYLKETLASRIEKHPSYSLRAFARQLGMDSSTLSALIRGKRPLTLKTAKKILDGLAIENPVEAENMLVATLKSVSMAEDFSKYGELSLEHAEMLSSWEHFAILAFLELRTLRANERLIASRLEIPLPTVWDCLQRLERLDLVRKNRLCWELTGKNIATPSDIPSTELRKGHKQNILKAIDSLDRDPILSRDISGITVAVSKSRVDGAKKMIKDFRRRLATYLEGDDNDAVYRLNIQLFPLTKEKN